MDRVKTIDVELIEPSEIISKPIEGRLISIDQVSKHIKTRSTLFLSVLANMSAGIKHGFSKISVTESGNVRKIEAVPAPDTLFTGDNLCNFACFAMKEALEKICDGIKVDVIQVNTDFDAENWDTPGYKYNTWGHSLIKVTQIDNGQVTFFDPTYGQIDHRRVGKIVQMTEEELINYYRNASGQMRHLEMNNIRNNQLQEADKYGLGGKQFETLIDTLL